MPEARDRRVTPLDVAAMYAQRRTSPFFVLDDSHPFTFGASPFGTRAPRNATGRGRALSLRAPGPENTPPLVARRGRARAPSRSVLPAWYPRTPLRNITDLVRAIERRRVPLGESNEGERTPLPERQSSDSSDAGARLENHAGESSSGVSPSPVSVKIRCSKVPKIVLEIAEDGDDSEFLTPQKKLLESIDTVEKVVREELQRLKRTPMGRRAEREKRVKTLMSMR